MNEDNNVLGTEQQEAADQTERSGAENKKTDVQGTGKTFTQDEVNKIVENRLKRERQKITEVMNQADPREAALMEKERMLNEKELRIEALDILREKNMPEDLLDILNYTDKEARDQSIERIEKAFKAAVQKAAATRLMGGPPIRKAPQEMPDNRIKNAFGL